MILSDLCVRKRLASTTQILYSGVEYSTKVPNFFVAMHARSILQTNSKFVDRGVKIDILYLRCGQEVKTIEHVLHDCE